MFCCDELIESLFRLFILVILMKFEEKVVVRNIVSNIVVDEF